MAAKFFVRRAGCLGLCFMTSIVMAEGPQPASPHTVADSQDKAAALTPTETTHADRRKAVSAPAHTAVATDKLEPAKSMQLDPWHSAAGKLVDQAMAAELSGNDELRNELLKQAVKERPDNALANWLLGRVRSGDSWRDATATDQRATWDLKLSEYKRLRDSMATAEDELRLAQFCESWDAERSKLHYWNVMRRSDSTASQRDVAARSLKVEQVGDAWLDPEQLAAYRDEVSRIQQALNTWLPRFEKFTQTLASPSARERQAVVDALADRGEDLAIAARYAGPLCSEPLALLLVDALAGQDTPEDGRALVEIAVWSSSDRVREAAVVAMKGRQLAETVPHLIMKLADPVRTQFGVFIDRAGNIHHVHQLVQEGVSQNLVWGLNETAVNQTEAAPIGSNVNYAAGLPPEKMMEFAIRRLVIMGQMMQNAQRTEREAQLLNQLNAVFNARICQILEAITGDQRPQTLSSWQDWWNEHNESYVDDSSKPSQVYAMQNVSSYYGSAVPYSVDTPEVYRGPISNEPTGTRRASVMGPRGRTITTHECFVADTLVWAEAGLRPIAEIAAGDRVLSQATDTGEVSYQLVTQVTVREPVATTVLETNQSSIRCTGGHPVWVAGQGWQMVKKLNDGDRVHALKGSTLVHNVRDSGLVEETYNLVVPTTQSYFVGEEAMLVGDNRIVAPTFRRLPGWK